MHKDHILEEVLTISNDDSIFDVVGKMEIFEDIALKNSNTKLLRILSFHHTYLLITKAVADKTYATNAFKNEQLTQKLDIAFAKKYFHALKAYVLKNEYITPWKSFYKLIDSDNYEPFTSLVAGINAHINGDLGQTLVDVNYFKYSDDFLLVNNILLEALPPVFQYLAYERRDIFGMATLILHELAEREFEKVIVKWRDQAWKNALLIHENKDFIKKVHEKTELIGDEINSLIHFKNGIILPRFLAAFEKLACVVEDTIATSPKKSDDILLLKLTSLTNVGSFLKWKEDKDILLPFREQKNQQIEGKHYLVKICFDEYTNRYFASERIDRYLRIDESRTVFRINQEVEGTVYDISEDGAKVAINDEYKSYVYENDRFKNLDIGHKIKAYVKNIREDGKIDLVLRKPGYLGVISDSTTEVLRILQNTGGFLPYNDKSDPEEIRVKFQMSKKVFKETIGRLYRERKIEITEKGIQLISDK